jgi:hypothetical protein
MTTPHGFLIAAILLAGLVLVTGCTTSSPAPVPPAGFTTVPMTSALPVSASPVIATQALAQCPQENSTKFISISTITDHYLGEIVTFSGTTNLPAGEKIILGIVTTSFHSCQKTRYPCENPDTVNAICCNGGFNRTIAIMPGNCGINSWSFTVNTSDYDFWPDFYIVYATSGKTYEERFFTIRDKVTTESAH